jgi:hypothetical protein
VATGKWKLQAIKQTNSKFSPYYAELQGIASDLDCNRMARRDSDRIGLSEEMTKSITYINKAEEIPTSVTLSQKRDNQMRQH